MLFVLRHLTLIVLTLLLTPLLVVLSVSILLFNLVHLLTRFTRQLPPELPALRSDLASIVILNWNGKDLLAEGIPSVLEAVRVDGMDHEVLVVDNGSVDGSVEFLGQNFPQVRVVPLAENLGFAQGNNIGVHSARHDIVILLNNDMIVDPGFLRPLLEGFGPNTFAVSGQIYLQNSSARREETGKTAAVFRHGRIDFTHADLDGRALSRPYYPALWAGGGSSAFDRRRFLQLGGFSEIYSPVYVEDADLSYQAWKAGWEVLFAPASVVYHKHRASSNRRFSPLRLQAQIQRNQLFFLWKNIRSWSLLLSHCLHLPWNAYRLARDFGLGVWRGLFQAMLMLPSVVVAKLSTPFRAVRSDAEIFDLFRNPGIYFAMRRPQRRSARPQVLWVTAYLPHWGRHAGAGRMYQILKRLTLQYRITLLTFLERNEEREFLSQIETLCERVIAIPRTPAFRWQLFAYEPFEDFRTPEMEEMLKECLEEQDFDLIQFEYSQMAGYADKSLGIPALGIPALLTKHEVDFAACLRQSRVESRPWAKFRWFYNYLQVLEREIRLLRRVDAAVCMTDQDARELRKFCSSVPIHVVNTGVDLDYFEPPKWRPSSPRLVFVGAFQHNPNVDAMVYFCSEIFPLIRAQLPETRLTIVGSHPTPTVHGLAGIPGVEVTGSVPDIRPYMAASSVYVVPLRLGVGIRGKILEAWSMSMAVVATTVACAGLRCTPGANLLLADDAELFAQHVVTLLNDPSLRQRLGEEGRRVAENYYSWDASAMALDRLYRQYLGACNESEMELAVEQGGRS